MWEGSEGEGEAGLEGRCEMSAYLFICVFIIIIILGIQAHVDICFVSVREFV